MMRGKYRGGIALLAAGAIAGGFFLFAIGSPSRTEWIDPPHKIFFIQRNSLPDAIALSPDGKSVAAGKNGSLDLWDVNNTADAQRRLNHRELWRHISQGAEEQFNITGRNSEKLNSIAYSPDGTKLLIGGAGGRVLLWDIENETILFDRVVKEDAAVSAAFSPDNLEALRRVCQQYQNTLEAREAVAVERNESTKLKYLIEHHSNIKRSPLGTQYFTVAPRVLALDIEADLYVAVWDIAAATQVRAVQTDDAPPEFAVVELSRTPKGVFPGAAGGRSILLMPAGLCQNGGEWDGGSRDALEEPLKMPFTFKSIAFSPDGKYVATRETAIDTRNFHKPFQLEFGWGRPEPMLHIGSASAIPFVEVLRLWDASSGRLRYTFHTPFVSKWSYSKVQFSSSGEFLMTEGDGAVWIVDVGGLAGCGV